MTGDLALKLDEIGHAATVSVSQWGVDAAAGSSFAMTPRGVAPQQGELILNTPYVFGVRAPSGEMLFLGRVMDPRQARLKQ